MRALYGYYSYFGDYDPATERCVESDPSGLSGGINTYTYVGSNLLMRIDRHGNERAGKPFTIWSVRGPRVAL